jgi:hypothetical protein
MKNSKKKKPQSLHDLKESIIEELPETNVAPSEETKAKMDEKIKSVEDLDLATAIEDDEDDEVLQKPEVDDLISDKPEIGDLQYTDGKERDAVDLAEEQEKIYGVDVVSPFKTGDIRVFKRKLKTMSRDQMTTLANRVAARVYSSERDQYEELLKAFYSWASTNSFIQTDATKKAEKGALAEAFEGSESVNSLEEKLKSKTLSDLQSTAARLGFNPSFDRERLIKVITQEYQRQS